MATLYCSGPAHLFVSSSPPLGSTSSALYLGTCEDTPNIEIHREYENVRNSIGGAVRFDKSYQGELAAIDLDINRYNEATLAILEGRPGLRTVRGTNGPADRGSLIMTEGLGLALYVLFQFGALGSAPKPAMIAQGLPAGYRFPCVEPVGPDRLGPLGTSPRKVHLLLEAIGLWTVATQSFLLYDFNVAGLPAIN